MQRCMSINIIFSFGARWPGAEKIPLQWDGTALRQDRQDRGRNEAQNAITNLPPAILLPYKSNARHLLEQPNPTFRPCLAFDQS